MRAQSSVGFCVCFSDYTHMLLLHVRDESKYTCQLLNLYITGFKLLFF